MKTKNNNTSAKLIIKKKIFNIVIEIKALGRALPVFKNNDNAENEYRNFYNGATRWQQI